MKTMRKVTLGILGAALLVGGFNNTSQAAVWCDNTTLNRVGAFPAEATANNSQYRVKLTCNDASPAWSGGVSFYLTPDLGESGYATALTAFSLGATMRVKLFSPVGNSLVLDMYMNELP